MFRYVYVVSFISISFVVLKLKVFCIDSASMKWPLFRVFLGAYTPKHCSVLLKFWQEVVSNKENTVFKKSFKNLNFSINGRHPKFTVLFHFVAQFTAGKPKILLKPKISAKTTSLGISNSARPRSQKNDRILVKLNKKETFSWGRKWV